METERENASYLSLTLESQSDKAEAFVSRISSETWALSDSKRLNPSKSHTEATGAFVADLLFCYAQEPTKCLYRRMMASSFTGERIGYRVFKRLVEGSLAAKLISVVNGSGGGGEIGVATRFKARSRLISIAEECGIELENLNTHFRPVPRPTRIAYPLLLRASPKQVGGKKERGRNIPIDYTMAAAAALAEQVNDLNSFFAGIQIEPVGDHFAFHRIFNQGDIRGFAWNKGGRLYSMGDSYQQRKQGERSCMKLNGESVAEIDIGASHLTILHAKLGHTFDPSSIDPYFHPDIPRQVLKGWVAMTLGHDRFHRAWTKDRTADYYKKTGRDLGKDFPISKVREEVLKLYPVLSEWPTCHIRWGDLQYIESCAVIDTVLELASDHEVPALPVHDSIIVPVSQEELARTVLKATFKKHVGVEPVLVTK